MYEKPSQEYEMSALAEASTMLKEIAEPRRLGDNVKSMIMRAARAVGWSYSRTKVIWYRDDRYTVSGDELNAVRAARARARATKAREREARGEYRELVDRIARVEAMVARDAHLAGAGADAVDEAAGATHRPLDRG